VAWSNNYHIETLHCHVNVSCKCTTVQFITRVRYTCITMFLLQGQVTIIFLVSVGLSVCLCRVFLSRLWSDFDETWTYVTCL